MSAGVLIEKARRALLTGQPNLAALYMTQALRKDGNK